MAVHCTRHPGARAGWTCPGCGARCPGCVYVRTVQTTELPCCVRCGALAERILDTTDYTVHDLRQAVERLYAEPGGGRPMMVTVVTFGYKFGAPFDLDLLFDLRFLPNPHFVAELKPLTGEDGRVREYVLGKPGSGEFLERLLDFLGYLLPRYRSEGKSYLTVGFGCPGGRHRSGSVAVAVAERLRAAGYEVNVKHRDILRT